MSVMAQELLALLDRSRAIGTPRRLATTEHRRNPMNEAVSLIDCGAVVSTDNGDTMCQLGAEHDGPCGTAADGRS